MNVSRNGYWLAASSLWPWRDRKIYNPCPCDTPNDNKTDSDSYGLKVTILLLWDKNHKSFMTIQLIIYKSGIFTLTGHCTPHLGFLG